MLKVYYAPDSRSVRVVWLLEELGLPYELERYKLGDPAMRTPEFRANVHPMGRVPVLEDGEVKIFESGAILQYIIARHGDGRLAPDVGSPDFPYYLQWLHFSEGMMMGHVGTIVVETIFLPEDKRNQTNVERATKLLTAALGIVDRHMEGREWLAGDFSAADIMTGHACSVAVRLGMDVSDKPNAAAYVERINARPALVRARAV